MKIPYGVIYGWKMQSLRGILVTEVVRLYKWEKIIVWEISVKYDDIRTSLYMFVQIPIFTNITK